MFANKDRSKIKFINLIYDFIKKIHNFCPIIMKIGQNEVVHYDHIVDFLIKAYF